MSFGVQLRSKDNKLVDINGGYVIECDTFINNLTVNLGTTIRLGSKVPLNDIFLGIEYSKLNSSDTVVRKIPHYPLVVAGSFFILDDFLGSEVFSIKEDTNGIYIECVRSGGAFIHKLSRSYYTRSVAVENYGIDIRKLDSSLLFSMSKPILQSSYTSYVTCNNNISTEYYDVYPRRFAFSPYAHDVSTFFKVPTYPDGAAGIFTPVLTDSSDALYYSTQNTIELLHFKKADYSLPTSDTYGIQVKGADNSILFDSRFGDVLLYHNHNNPFENQNVPYSGIPANTEHRGSLIETGIIVPEGFDCYCTNLTSLAPLWDSSSYYLDKYNTFFILFTIRPSDRMLCVFSYSEAVNFTTFTYDDVTSLYFSTLVSNFFVYFKNK